MEWIMLEWKLILAAVIALAFVLLIGGYYWKLKKEIEEFVEAIQEALMDGRVNDIEVARIIKEMKDVGSTLKAITGAVIGLISKR